MSTQPTTTAARAAREIRALMALHEPRLTGQDLADLLGKSQQSAARRMSGKTPLTLEELWQIAAWLDVPVTRLTDAPAPEPATP